MKSLKNFLRLWISFTSLFGFFGAWAMLAQSFRPVQAQPTPATAYPTLVVLNPINLNSVSQPNVNLQVVTPVPTPIPLPPPLPAAPPVFQRLLRTGGSG